MVQLDLIEEQLLARTRVLDDRGRELSDAQPVSPRPFADHPRLATRPFDLAPVGCVEELLPRHIDPFGEVPHVHQALRLERFAYRRLESLIDGARVE